MEKSFQDARWCVGYHEETNTFFLSVNINPCSQGGYISITTSPTREQLLNLKTQIEAKLQEQEKVQNDNQDA